MERRVYEPPNGFGDYMRDKVVKLSDQFRSSALKSNIFDGCFIYVNGYTQPSSSELRLMIADNGGRFSQFPVSDVTHIIATTLPDNKIQEAIGKSSGAKVVTPQWIVDSIQQNRLLPCFQYRTVDALPPSFAFSRQKDVSVSSSFTAVPRKIPELEFDSSVSITKSVPIEIPESDETKKLVREDWDTGAIQDRSQRDSYWDMEFHANGSRPTCISDPKAFIKCFYRQSRLHHISTWKSNFQVEISRKIQGVRHSKGAGASTATSLSPKADGSQAVSSTPSQFSEILSGSSVLNSDKANAVINTMDSYSDVADRNEIAFRKCYFYVDLDCFFASVACIGRPELIGKPIAVAHSALSVGESAGKMGAEISSCSYEARKFGVKNGMWVEDAMKLCPELVLAPYDFEAYERISRIMYDVLLRYSLSIQVCSVDEAILEMTGFASDIDQYRKLAEKLRKEILSETGGCTASVGIGPNLLLAKVALKLAKPDGIFVVPSGKDIPESLPVRDLPGVGWSVGSKLKENGIETIVDLRKIQLSALVQIVGESTAKQLCRFSNGIDDRKLQLAPHRKSISAGCNYGIRFHTEAHVENFFLALAEELAERMENAKVVGNLFALGLFKREPDAPQPRKFMGCGIVTSISRQTKLVSYSQDAKIIFGIAMKLYKSLGLEATNVRGVTFTMNHLRPFGENGEVKRRCMSIDDQLFLAPKQAKESENLIELLGETNLQTENLTEPLEDTNLQDTGAFLTPTTSRRAKRQGYSPMSQIDPEVWLALPRYCNYCKSWGIRAELRSDFLLRQNEVATEAEENRLAVVLSTPLPVVGDVGKQNNFKKRRAVRRGEEKPRKTNPTHKNVIDVEVYESINVSGGTGPGNIFHEAKPQSRDSIEIPSMPMTPSTPDTPPADKEVWDALPEFVREEIEHQSLARKKLRQMRNARKREDRKFTKKSKRGNELTNVASDSSASSSHGRTGVVAALAGEDVTRDRGTMLLAVILGLSPRVPDEELVAEIEMLCPSGDDVTPMQMLREEMPKLFPHCPLDRLSQFMRRMARMALTALNNSVSAAAAPCFLREYNTFVDAVQQSATRKYGATIKF